MKKKKWLLYGVLPLLVIFIVAVVFLGNYTDKVVDPHVRSLLEVTKPMGHQVEYRKIRVNLFQRYISIKEVKISPDTSRIKNKPMLELEVNEIRLTGFNIRQLLFDKTLSVIELVIENPDVKIILPEEAGKVVQDVRENKSQKKQSPLLTHINLEKIIFSGGSFQLLRDDVVLAKAPGINLIAQSISLEKDSIDKPMGFKYGDIALYLTDIELEPDKGLYDMKLAGFSFTKSDSTILLNGFSMIPKHDKKVFSKKLGFQNDRFAVNIGQIKIGQIGIERFMAGQTLEIASILIEGVDADIYRDKNVTFNFDRFPRFYNESFMKIPVPVYLDTVAIINSKITYGELAEKSDNPWAIVLEDFNLQIYNLTNQVADDTIDNVMLVNVSGRVMGEGLLKIELALPLEGNLKSFTCSGSIGSMNLNPLNDMLEPAINMKFNEGRLNKMDFNFKANDNLSLGWMEFYYQDLDVELLKKDPEKDWGFVSNLANSMVLTSNPHKEKELKIVEIGYERDKNKGIINYVWKTIQSGIIRTVLPIKKYQINRKSKEKAQDKGKDDRKKRDKKK